MPSNKIPGSATVRTTTAPAGIASGGSPAFVGGLSAHILDPANAHAATAISYDGGPNWKDGTTNPATEVDAQLDKIITDLGQGSNGAERITFDGSLGGTWANGGSLSSEAVGGGIREILSDLGAQVATDGATRIGTQEVTSSGSFGVVSAGSVRSHLDNLLNSASHLTQDNTFIGTNTFGGTGNHFAIDGQGGTEVQFQNVDGFYRVSSADEELQWDIGSAGEFNLMSSFAGTKVWGITEPGTLTSNITTEVYTNASAHTIDASYVDFTWEMPTAEWVWKIEDLNSNIIFGLTRSASEGSDILELGLANVSINGDTIDAIYSLPASLTWRYTAVTTVGSSAGGEWILWGQNGAPVSSGDKNDGGGFRFIMGGPGSGGTADTGKSGPMTWQFGIASGATGGEVRHYYFVDKAVDSSITHVVWEDPEGAIQVGETVYAIVRRLSVFSGAGAQPSGAGSTNTMFQTSNSYMYWTRNSTNTDTGSNPPDQDVQGNPIFDQETNHNFTANVPEIETEYSGNASGDSPSGLRDVHYFLQVFRARD